MTLGRSVWGFDQSHILSSGRQTYSYIDAQDSEISKWRSLRFIPGVGLPSDVELWDLDFH
jgi:hypothetical protein